MKKIKPLFCRNEDGQVRNEVNPGCEWVINGEGTATMKYDGTCCLIKDGVMYRRYDAKHGKTPPADFTPAQEPDDTGHWPGWIPVSKEKPQDTYHIEAYNHFKNFIDGHVSLGALLNGIEYSLAYKSQLLSNCTYELVGPKINGNPEGCDNHRLLSHGSVIFYDCPRSFNEIKEYLADKDIEGIVWHHEDGRMVKIRKKDFGLKRDPMAP